MVTKDTSKGRMMMPSKTLDWHEKQGRIEYRRYPMHLTADMVENLMFKDDGIFQLLKEGADLKIVTVGSFRSILVQIR